MLIATGLMLYKPAGPVTELFPVRGFWGHATLMLPAVRVVSNEE